MAARARDESEAPFIFTLLGDALLRLREVDQALVILNEAEQEWPDNQDVQVRIGSALAMSGKRAEALQKIEPYWTVTRKIRSAISSGCACSTRRADGKPIKSTNEDRALFTKWAAAYAAAKARNRRSSTSGRRPWVSNWPVFRYGKPTGI